MVAVITAGGKGTRLSSIAGDIPKPLVKIGNKPILEHQIDCLRKNGIDTIFILIGFLGDKIKDYFKDGKGFGVTIRYIEENEPLGSCGALYYLRNSIIEDFIFIYGDLMFDVDFKRMISFHKNNKAQVTLLSHPNSHPGDSDLIICENEVVSGIDSKHNIRNYFYHNLVNSGIYIVSNKILEEYFTFLKKTDFEKDILVKLISSRVVYSYNSTEYVKDAGTVDRYHQVNDDYNKGIIHRKNLIYKQKCVFIDRDGTINKYKGFIRNIDEIKLEDGVVEGIRYINNSDYLLIVITNQPVIARGEVSFEELDEFHKKIETLLGESGVYFNKLYFCPHHPDSGFEGEIKELKKDCNCRKPNIGLLLKAQKEFNIDFSKSFFVGDSTTDIMTGINAGIDTILVKTGLCGNDKKYYVEPNYVIDNLAELPNILKNRGC